MLFFKSGKPVAVPKPEKNPYSDDYFILMEKIEIAWSVLNNLRSYTGDQADALERMCLNGADLYKQMTEYDAEMGFDPPPHAPCYVRLAMLYEKQERYQEGIETCVAAIKAGAYSDSTNGKMYGRLARLIRKSGIKVTDDIIKYTQGA